MKTSVAKAHLALLAAMLIWGSSFIAFKFLLDAVPPMTIVFLRMIIAVGFFIIIWPWVRKYSFQYQKGDWRWLMGLALCEPCLYFVFESQALQHTSAGQAGMIAALLPIMVALTAYFTLKEKNKIKQWIGFIIAVLGVLIMTLTTSQSEQAPNALFGNFLEFLAMITAVGYTIMVKHIIARYSALLITAFQSLIGSLFFLPLAIQESWHFQASFLVWGIIVYLSLIVSIGAYSLYGLGMKTLSASTAASYANLLPAFTLIFSMILLKENIEAVQWVAIVVVFVGVGLAQERKVN